MPFASTGLHISRDGENNPPQLSWAAAFLHLADWRCQALSLALCRNALAVCCQHGRITLVCEQPPATRHQALADGFMGSVPVSSVWLCMYAWHVCLSAFSNEPAMGAFLPLLWGIFLPCRTGLVSTVNGKTWKQQEVRWMERGGEEMKGNPTTTRRNMLVDWMRVSACECVWVRVCACAPCLLINFPKIPLPYNPEARSKPKLCKICFSLLVFVFPLVHSLLSTYCSHAFFIWFFRLNAKQVCHWVKANTCTVQSMGI